ncbi:hypothetical protein DPEC_G00202020 [Dallia pectoralis]|uniref:Uncharacterized protein n=1 Tax=Dallia pectoralis TaxID=75939 RepID=A0ACC2G955_DALPE|nr:hypothetical protein DPEC_G00202020 [Dallia pectoralis]
MTPQRKTPGAGVTSCQQRFLKNIPRGELDSSLASTRYKRPGKRQIPHVPTELRPHFQLSPSAPPRRQTLNSEQTDAPSLIRNTQLRCLASH